jgi:hypothetical protein
MTYRTNAEWLHAEAAKAGIPLRTLDQVKAGLAQAKKNKCEARMARLMLRHGRLTDEAILYIGDNYPSVWED